MQKKKENIKKTTFSSAWEGLTTIERQTVLRQIILENRVSPQTVWNWRVGRTRPSWLYQLGVAHALKAVTGDSYDPESLFPAL